MKRTDVVLKKDDHFVGVPAPALAFLALMPIYMHLYGWKDTDLPIVRAAYIMGVGLLAVSTIPTLSIRHARIRRPHLPFAVVGLTVLVTCLIVYPWPTLITGDFIYLASLPISYLIHHKHIKALQDDHAHSVD